MEEKQQQIIKIEEYDNEENDTEKNSSDSNDDIGNSRENIRFAKKLTSYLTLVNFNIALIGGFIIICVSYLVVSNQLISRGFAINDVKTNLENLQKENRELELATMNFESYAYINEKVTKLGMVKIGEVEYIEAVNNSVAMR